MSSWEWCARCATGGAASKTVMTWCWTLRQGARRRDRQKYVGLSISEGYHTCCFQGEQRGSPHRLCCPEIRTTYVRTTLVTSQLCCYGCDGLMACLLEVSATIETHRERLNSNGTQAVSSFRWATELSPSMIGIIVLSAISAWRECTFNDGVEA